jgi:hypothetical protein
LGAFVAILAVLSILSSPAAHARGGAVEKNLAASLTAMPTKSLVVPGAFYVPVYSSVLMSQGQAAGGFFGDAWQRRARALCLHQPGTADKIVGN